jgi:hypothetical protein
MGTTSLLLPCGSGNGEQLVLKLTPDLKIAADEVALLVRQHAKQGNFSETTVLRRGPLPGLLSSWFLTRRPM